jgi:hypothetical protein
VVRLRDWLEGGVRGRRCAAIGLGAMHSYAVEFASLEELQAHALSPHFRHISRSDL